jgi:hypothetical protein
MKVKDIVSEAYKGYGGHLKDFGTTRGKVDSSLPNAFIEPELRNTDSYMQTRYGQALAAAAAMQNGEKFEQESAWAENFGMVAYSDQEIDIIKQADKLMGVRSIQLSNKSQEKEDIGSKSPVADTSWRKAKK